MSNLPVVPLRNNPLTTVNVDKTMIFSFLRTRLCVSGFLLLALAWPALAQNNGRPLDGAPQGRPAGPPDYFSLGIAAGAGTPEFTGSDFIVNAFPFIGFKQGRFFSNQAGVGYAIYQRKGLRLSALTEFGVQELNRNDVDALDDMENLDLPLYAGLSLDIPLNGFVLTGTAQREVGFAGDGWRAITSISRPVQVNRRLTLSPAISLQWQDDKITSYLYGVSDRDVLPDRSLYDADDSFKVSAGVTGIYRLGQKFTLVGSTGVIWHSNEIVNSPIVDERTIFSTFLAIGYNF